MAPSCACKLAGAVDLSWLLTRGPRLLFTVKSCLSFLTAWRECSSIQEMDYAGLLRPRCRHTGLLPLCSLGLEVTEPIQMPGEGSETIFLNGRKFEFAAIFKL